MTEADTPPAESMLRALQKTLKGHWSRFLKWKNMALVLGSVAVMLGIIAGVASISALLQGPTAGQANAAEWLSAISTFWGAVATALGAALTGGALLIAALTYQRQVRDRHAELESKRRAQAEAVTVRIVPFKPAYVAPGTNPPDRVQIEVRNDGELAVFGIAAVVLDRTRREVGQKYFQSILPHTFDSFRHLADKVDGAYATFTDSAGTRWKRWHNGDLEEIAHYPRPDE
ncbi:hypothetical protein E2F48_01955 [Arthrobacter crusticola]|uniref:Uncharacterized protein n=1 Tax=Arthrobacter crusticola TaxID=2547960 RepID=A0A4R5U2T4_9MICC|nr:hypothetical protein [Arthrobacter crusticola]TDK27902.1 hypothetical protein E2F48_01955 [Arthrobacter crusticola]